MKMKSNLLTTGFFLLGFLFVPARGQTPAQNDEPEYYSENPQLDTYIRAALDQNPAAQESLARYRAALQKVPQVTSLLDPMVNYTQFIRNVETRVGPQLQSFMFSQKFPWFGELDLKGKTVFKEAAALYQLYRARQREIIHQVKRAFYELSYLDRALEINREEQLLLEHYERLARSRYSAGQGLQNSVVKMQAEITKILNRLKILDQQRESRVAWLNTLMNRRPEGPVPLVHGLPLPQVNLDLEELYGLGERNRQELKAVGARIEKNEQAIELAKKGFWPDFTLGAGFVNVGQRNDPAGLLLPPPDNGKNSFNFSIGVNLPIWRNKYRAEELQATETLIAERRNYLHLRNEMEFSIRDQVIRLQTLLEQIELFETALIPQAETALRSTETAYTTGQLRALDLLDSERMLLDVRLINARYYADYLGALSSLERAVGTRFPR